MKIAIVGSRNYPRLDLVRAYVRSLPPGTTVVSGHGGDVDLTAEREAFACGLIVESYPALWKEHGRAADPIRNADIVAAADRVLAYWDGKSRGTLDTIRRARVAKRELAIIGPDGKKMKPPGLDLGS